MRPQQRKKVEQKQVEQDNQTRDLFVVSGSVTSLWLEKMHVSGMSLVLLRTGALSKALPNTLCKLFIIIIKYV